MECSITDSLHLPSYTWHTLHNTLCITHTILHSSCISNTLQQTHCASHTLYHTHHASQTHCNKQTVHQTHSSQYTMYQTQCISSTTCIFHILHPTSHPFASNTIWTTPGITYALPLMYCSLSFTLYNIMIRFMHHTHHTITWNVFNHTGNSWNTPFKPNS